MILYFFIVGIPLAIITAVFIGAADKTDMHILDFVPFILGVISFWVFGYYFAASISFPLAAQGPKDSNYDLLAMIGLSCSILGLGTSLLSRVRNRSLSGNLIAALGTTLPVSSAIIIVLWTINLKTQYFFYFLLFPPFVVLIIPACLATVLFFVLSTVFFTKALIKTSESKFITMGSIFFALFILSIVVDVLPAIIFLGFGRI